ncbi:MAG: aromatic aminobenezylarsenical efflux permease ArsG family transporter, partial [Planctomycetia bacterium]|nr:aromatic aminobenezylarsenical efflux permease ArsG family transporter [Planctomycetia bacterium]
TFILKQMRRRGRVYTFSGGMAKGGVFLLGVQTSISPCPLATNIAAISYIGRKAGNSKQVLWSGLLYTLGRMMAYVVLAMLLLIFVLFSGDQLTRFFQTVIHGYLGPIMILIGMFLLGLLSFSLDGSNTEKMQKLVDRFGLWSALPIGIIFALAFCPTSAATFLAMIGLATKVKSSFIFPAVFGISTALPVLIFTGILAFQSNRLANAFQVVGKIDWWSRTITGIIFLVIGIWFSLQYCWDVLL